MKNCSARLPDRLTQLGRSTGSVLLKFFFAFEEESGADIWIDSLHVVLGFVAGPDRRGPWEPAECAQITHVLSQKVEASGRGAQGCGGEVASRAKRTHYYIIIKVKVILPKSLSVFSW